MYIDFTKLIKDNFKDFKNFDFSFDKKIYFYARVKDGNDIILFVNKIVEFFPDKLISVYCIYQVLERINFLNYEKTDKLNLKNTNVFRTLFISTISSSIVELLKDGIKEKGEIYYPTNPLSIEFHSIKIYVEDVYCKSNFSPEKRIPEIISGGGRYCYELIPTKTLLTASFYFKNKRHMKVPGDNPDLPINIIKRGYPRWGEFLKEKFIEQIRIINNTKVKKGSLLDLKIKLISIKDIHHQNFEPNTLKIVYKNGLYILQHRRMANISLIQRPIKKRFLESIRNDILIFFDTEWKWEKDNKEKDYEEEEDNNIGSIKFPDYLTYVIVYGEDVLNLGPDKIDYKNKSGYFKGKDSIYDFLKLLETTYTNKKSGSMFNITCIAHNASSIENHFILNCITKYLSMEYDNYEIKLTHVNGTNIHSFRWKSITFIDSMLFMSGSLKNITKSICKKHTKLDIDKEILLNADWKNPTQELIEYAINDTLSLAEAWVRFNLGLNEIMSTYTTDNFSLTNFRSGASIMKWWLTNEEATYKSSVIEQKIRENKLGWDSIEMLTVRNIVFMGGRTECYYIGDSKLFNKSNTLLKNKDLNNISYEKNETNTTFCINIDITSSYPYCMTYNSIPGRTYKSGEYNSKEELLNIIKKENENNRIVYIYGKLKYLKEEDYPLLGIKIEDKLIFPNFMSGMYNISFWDFEFLAIKDNISDVFCVGDYIIFEKYDGFKSKIKSLFYSRQKEIEKGNKGKAFIYKILMNSGYGSLAINNKRETVYLVKGNKYTRLLRLYDNLTIQDATNGFKWVIIKKFVEVNSLLFSASYITAKARYNLWKEGKRLVEEEGAVLIYSDTDSHKFVDFESKKEYYEKIYGVNKELGRWILEGTYNDWEIATLKVYRMGDIVKYKGVTGTKEELTNEDGSIKKTLVTIIWTRGRDGELRTKKVLKNMDFKYTKGEIIIGEKGKVNPFSL